MKAYCHSSRHKCHKSKDKSRNFIPFCSKMVQNEINHQDTHKENENAPKSSVDIGIETKATFGLKGVGEMVIDFSITNEDIPKVPSLSGITQEPWPEGVILFQSYREEQMILPDLANCLAVEAFLKMCRLNYRIEQRPNAEAMSPTLKLPFIKAGRFVVAELENIVHFANGKGVSLTDQLDIDQKADMSAYMSLISNVLELAELYICWFDRETYAKVTSVKHGFVYPWPLNHIYNRLKRGMVKRKLKALDWYHKSIKDVCLDAENCCEAISIRLEEEPYFFGKSPTQLDALLFGHLFAILFVSLPNKDLRNIVESYPNLIEFVQRIKMEYIDKSEL